MVSVIIQKYHAIHLIRGCRDRGDAGAGAAAAPASSGALASDAQLISTPFNSLPS